MRRDGLPLRSSYETVHGEESLLSELPDDVLGCNLVAVLQQLRLLMREAGNIPARTCKVPTGACLSTGEKQKNTSSLDCFHMGDHQETRTSKMQSTHR